MPDGRTNVCSRSVVERNVRWFILKLMLLLQLAFFSTGCQTFNLTEEEFAKQQNGGVVDQTTGEVVAIGGTAGYLGGIAAALATAHW